MAKDGSDGTAEGHLVGAGAGPRATDSRSAALSAEPTWSPPGRCRPPRPRTKWHHCRRGPPACSYLHRGQMAITGAIRTSALLPPTASRRRRSALLVTALLAVGVSGCGHHATSPGSAPRGHATVPPATSTTTGFAGETTVTSNLGVVPAPPVKKATPTTAAGVTPGGPPRHATTTVAPQPPGVPVPGRLFQRVGGSLPESPCRPRPPQSP